MANVLETVKSLNSNYESIMETLMAFREERPLASDDDNSRIIDNMYNNAVDIGATIIQLCMLGNIKFTQEKVNMGYYKFTFDE